MVTIRPEQDEAFRRAALRGFEDEMVEHLKKFAPKHCEVIGEPVVRKVIGLGMERARTYGFTNRGPVRFFLELMLLFGTYFDSDPQLPWAANILNDIARLNQMSRAHRLHAKTMEYLDEVAGPRNEYYIEALRRISRARVEDFPVSGSDFAATAVRALNTLYPQKCEYILQAPLRALVRQILRDAVSHGFLSWNAMALFIVLGFVLGHRCTSDPQFPWISAALEDTAGRDPDARAERLHKKAAAYLAGVLA